MNVRHKGPRRPWCNVESTSVIENMNVSPDEHKKTDARMPFFYNVRKVLPTPPLSPTERPAGPASVSLLTQPLKQCA
jgi:hypothetical protein